MKEGSLTNTLILKSKSNIYFRIISRNSLCYRNDCQVDLFKNSCQSKTDKNLNLNGNIEFNFFYHQSSEFPPLRELSKKSMIVITCIVNAVLRWKNFLHRWKMADVVVLHRLGKPNDLTQSYRPNSLLSTMSARLSKGLPRID